MKPTLASYLRSVLRGCLTAIAIGLAVAGGYESVAASAKGEALVEVISFHTFGEAGIVAIPFVLLALLGIWKIKCWLAGIVVTCGVWGFLYLPGAMSISGGVNFGWGLTVIFGPIVVFTVSLLMLLPEAAAFDQADGL